MSTDFESLETPLWRRRLNTGLIYLAVAFLVTAPAWLSSDALIGGGDQPDWTGTAWAFWWTGHAITHGLNPFDGTYNFFPVGQRPLAQYNLLDALLAWPLLMIFGARVGYNLFATLTLATSAVGAHVLSRAVGTSRLVAIFTGVALETSTYFLLELTHGRLSQSLMIFWLLGLAGIVRIATGQGSIRIAVLTGVAAAAAHLTYWYYGLFLTLAAIPIWLGEFWFWTLRRWRNLLIAAGVTVGICMPYVLALVAGYDNLPGVVRDLEPWMEQYGSLGRGEFGLSMAINQSHWPLWPLLHTANDPEDKRIALVLLGLACGGALTASIYGRKRWMLLAGGGWLLTLGPYLKWTGLVPLRIALPYLWLYDHLPFFQRFWWPQRLEILTLVGLLILAALFLEHLCRIWPERRRLIVGLAIAAVAIDAPLRNPYLPVEAHPPREFNSRLYEVVNGPILTTPVLSLNEISRHMLWLQIFHEQPILGGLGDHIPAHRPSRYTPYIRQNRVLASLEQVSLGTFKGATITPDDVAALIEDGFAYAVVDPVVYSPGLEGAWAASFTEFFQAIWGKPMVSSGAGRVWRISRIPAPVEIDEIIPVEVSGPRLSNDRAVPTE
jgi:hypothetical protein